MKLCVNAEPCVSSNVWKNRHSVEKWALRVSNIVKVKISLFIKLRKSVDIYRNSFFMHESLWKNEDLYSTFVIRDF